MNINFRFRWRSRPRARHGSALAFLIDSIVIAIIAATVYFICTGLPGVVHGGDQAGPPPRVLVVWHNPAVPNSRQFFDDLQLQGLAGELLEAGWMVERRDVRNHPLQAWALNIQAVPCFVIPGCEFWYGYDRERFREYFGLAPRPDQAATISAPEQLAGEQLQQLLAEQFEQQRAEFERQLTATTEADQARQLALEQTIAQQQQQLDELERGNPETDQRIGQLEQWLHQVVDRDQVEAEPPAAPGEQPAAARETPAAEAGILSRVITAGGHSLTVLQALGLLGATSTGLGGAALLVRFLWRRRQQRRAPSTGRADKPAVVKVESPPLPQAIVPENTFVPYERDTFAEAFAWAEREVVRKYPGAVDQMEFLKSLIHQHLASRGVVKTKV